MRLQTLKGTLIKKYQIENVERISERRKEYSKKNRKRITEYYLNKGSNDPLFKLSTQVRGLIRISLKKERLQQRYIYL